MRTCLDIRGLLIASRPNARLFGVLVPGARRNKNSMAMNIGGEGSKDCGQGSSGEFGA